MSRQNKVNKNNYVQKGRLTPDDMARERSKQRQIEHEIQNEATDRPPPGGRESTRARSAPEE
jgi:hypothetical protein